MLSLEGATAMAPIDENFTASKIGVHVTPPFVLFQTPPADDATYMTLPQRSPGWCTDGTAISLMRPLMTAGPMERKRRSASSAESGMPGTRVATAAGFCATGRACAWLAEAPARR